MANGMLCLCSSFLCDLSPAAQIFLSGHISKASDVYAYGILLYELITGGYC
jgi:serine/threonine protein kinase